MAFKKLKKVRAAIFILQKYVQFKFCFALIIENRNSVKSQAIKDSVI